MKKERFFTAFGSLILIVIAAVLAFQVGVSNGEAKVTQNRDQFLRERGITFSNITPTPAIAGQRSMGPGTTPIASPSGTPGSTSQIPGPGGRPGLTGTIEAVDGNNLTINTGSGNIKVKLADNATIQMLVNGTSSDLKTGNRVTINGNQNSDGSYTAQGIQIAAQQGRP